MKKKIFSSLVKNLQEDYISYCKPGLGKMLSAFGLDVSFIKAQGDYLWFIGPDGREEKVLDLVGSFGATLFGHNPKILIADLIKNLKKSPPHLVQGSVRIGATELGAKLHKITLDRFGVEYLSSFFSTGTEAVEAAIKHLILINIAKNNRLIEDIFVSSAFVVRKQDSCCFSRVEVGIEGFPNRSFVDSEDLLSTLDDFNKGRACEPFKLIALENAFHGKTLGSLSLTNNSKYRDPFLNYLLPVLFIPPDPEILKNALETNRKNFAKIVFKNGNISVIPSHVSEFLGFFVEPVLGEGGAYPIPSESLATLCKISQSESLPIVADEIQSGMGRTGTFFAWERGPFPPPDVFLLSKFLGGGVLKLSAVLTRKEIAEDEFGITHTSTFAEDELSCKLGARTLDLLLADDEKLLKQCSGIGIKWLNRLSKLKERFPDVIREVRGAGLLIGIEFHDFRESGSNLLRFVCTQGDFGYFLANFLLHETRIRVAPTLNSKRTVRIEPSLFSGPEEIDQVISAFSKLCEVLRKKDTFHLVKYILPEFREHPPAPLEIRDFNQDPAKKMQPAPLAPDRVAFLGHFIDPTFLGKHEPSLGRFSKDQLEKLILKTYEHIDPCLFVSRDITSATGAKLNFNFIGLSVTSQIILDRLKRRDLKLIRDQIRQGVLIAKERGCRLVGFGQFTSIVTRNCKTFAVPNVFFTSGNALTTGMAFTGVESLLTPHGWNWENVTCAVIGGGGNIGSTFGRLVADKACRILLVGGNAQDSQSKIEAAAAKIYEDQVEKILTGKSHGPIAQKLKDLFSLNGLRKMKKQIHGDDKWGLGLAILEKCSKLAKEKQPIFLGTIDDLKKCEVAITATNTTQPFIFPEHLRDEVIICDISIPTAISPEAVRRGGVEAFKGGVVALPRKETLNIGALPLEPGLVYSCMAETIILGLERRWINYSVGDINKEQVLEILKLARKHGFSLARLKSEDSL